MPDTRGPGALHVVMNLRAGAGDKDAARDAIAGVLTRAGRAHTFNAPRDGEALDALCDRVAGEAARDGGVLVAAGGDGTLNAVVNAARAREVPAGLVPLGTFNYLAREQGIPLDPAEAAQVLVAGQRRRVTMGEVNGRLFFNNASFGLYTTLIHDRERAKKRFGRHRLVAAISGIRAMLRGQRPFAIQVVADGTVAPRYTSLVFVACNALQLEHLGLKAAADWAPEALAVALLPPTTVMQRLRLLLRTAMQQLEEESRLEVVAAQRFDVHSRRRVIEVVVDGETLRLPQPLRFRAVPHAVELLVPAAAT